MGANNYVQLLASVILAMNKLEYSISLREKGFASNDIKKKMKEKGLFINKENTLMMKMPLQQCL